MAGISATLAVLAAGLGTRFGGSGAKQLQTVGPSGERIIDYSIYDALRSGFSRVVLVIRPEQEADFEEELVARWRERVKIEIVHQRSSDASPKRVWGTAHAALCLAGRIDEPFALLNGDDFYGREAIELVARYCEGARLQRSDGIPEYAVVGFAVGDTMTTGNEVNRALLHCDSTDSLTRIEEARVLPAAGGTSLQAQPLDGIRRAIPRDARVSMNLWGFTPAIFPQLESAFMSFAEQHSTREFLLPAFVQGLLERSAASVRMLRGTGSPSGITHPEDRATMQMVLTEKVERGLYPSPIWRSELTI